MVENSLLPLSWYCRCEHIYLVWRFQKEVCRYTRTAKTRQIQIARLYNRADQAACRSWCTCWCSSCLKQQQKNVCSQRILLSLLWPRKEKIVKNVTKRNRQSRKQMSNVWVVRLTCVSRVIETVCSVFMSVGIIHCNVCAYAALHFQWFLFHHNIMKSVCDSRDCENMSVL